MKLKAESDRGTELMKMQYGLLSDRFADDSNANASAASLIKNMADGTLAQHAGALKFGLREGFSRMEPVAPVVVPAPAPAPSPAPDAKTSWKKTFNRIR